MVTYTRNGYQKDGFVVKDEEGDDDLELGTSDGSNSDSSSSDSGSDSASDGGSSTDSSASDTSTSRPIS